MLENLKNIKSQTWLFIVVALLAVGIGLFVQLDHPRKPAKLSLQKAILLPQSKELLEVNFTDHNGQAFNKDRLLGKWSVLFFGFTNCPDICPTTLQTLANTKQQMTTAGAWNNLQVVMISVDPERDSQQRLNSYVPWFDQSFIGLTGELEYTREFAKHLGILFYKSKQQSETVYEVDHSASLILINPQGQYAGAITAPHQAEVIANDLALLTSQSVSTSVALNDPQEPSQSLASLAVSRAWIRPAPPGATSLAGYLSLKNQSNNDIKIVEVHAPDFDMAMLHNTVIEDDVASMEHLDELLVPAGESVDLKPLGKHMMLMRPKRGLPEGSFTRITLIDENDQHYPLLIEVKTLSTE